MNNVYSTPASDLVDDPLKLKTPNILWKVYFWFSVITTPLIIVMPFITIMNALDYLDILTTPFLLVSLYGYAFSKKIGPQRIWKLVCYLYPVWLVFADVIAPFVLNIPRYGESVQVDGFLLLTGIFASVTFAYLYLYSRDKNTVWSTP